MARSKYHIDEKETGTLEFTIQDENGSGIPGSQLSQARLTLYNVATGAIVNGRNAQNVLNTNNVTISDVGLVKWTVQLADVTLAEDGPDVQVHRALFQFWWQADARHKPHEVDLVIKNLGKLT